MPVFQFNEPFCLPYEKKAKKPIEELMDENDQAIKENQLLHKLLDSCYSVIAEGDKLLSKHLLKNLSDEEQKAYKKSYEAFTKNVI